MIVNWKGKYMLKILLVVFGVLILLFVLVFCYSCCVISSECSRLEESRDGLYEQMDRRKNIEEK